MEGKCCRKCSVELSLGDNWTFSQQNRKNYICKPCHYKQSYSIVKKKQGVYGIFSEDECLYVGESSGLNKRIWNHKYWINNPNKYIGSHHELYIRISEYDNVQIKILEETRQHKEREEYWINQLQPLFNSYV